MLSVDSGGNFRYYSGTGEKKTMRGFEYLPREIIQTNASILTDRFTSLTADKIATNNSCLEKIATTTTATTASNNTKYLSTTTNIQSANNTKLKNSGCAPLDFISAFEALPEKSDEEEM